MSDGLMKLTRGDLDTVAAALGVSEPDKLADKQEVADAILATRHQEPSEVVDERQIERKLTVGATPGYEDKVRTWWCPFCDHSNGGEQVRCGGCSAERDEATETATRRTFEG